jgi:hypothetical protein
LGTCCMGWVCPGCTHRNSVECFMG